MNRVYGWKPDIGDQRDYQFKVLRRTVAALPPKVDLRSKCSAVEDQGQLGSCTANALVGAVEFLYGKTKGAFQDFSRLFVYYNERVIEGTVNSDSGAMIRDGIKTLAKQGVCLESTWAYDISRFRTKPPSQAFAEALNHQILTYARLATLNDMKTCLASGLPFTFGFTVYESFESDTVARTGIVPMPGKTERALGGHAVLAVGYDDSSQRFIVRNSWGTGWGQKGYFTMPYKYLSNSNLSDDFWAIQKEEC